MRRSQIFLKTRKETPSDEESKNAQLLIRAGYIHKEMAGVYSYLPLGMMAIENIKQVIREEMDAIGGQEMVLSTLQSPHLWKNTDRWDDSKVDIWFKSSLGENTEIGFGWSHEEPMANMMKQFVTSYKDLPVFTYQFQNKLRKELRAKSGLLRGREFIMKDLYSFCTGKLEHEKFYEKTSQAYMRVYGRLGIGDITYMTFASGGPFSKFSHEFQTLSDIGEDEIYLDNAKKIAVNVEVATEEVLAELGLHKDRLSVKKAVEVGNIFTFGSRYSEPLGLFFTDEKGNSQPVYMGSYGIGVSRLLGLLAELFSDEHGLVLPPQVAPFLVYLAQIGDAQKEAEETYNHLLQAGISVLYDDRDERPGEKFADADLLGIPLRIVVSQKAIQAGGAEVKKRGYSQTEITPTSGLLEYIEKSLQG